MQVVDVAQSPHLMSNVLAPVASNVSKDLKMTQKRKLSGFVEEAEDAELVTFKKVKQQHSPHQDESSPLLKKCSEPHFSSKTCSEPAIQGLEQLEESSAMTTKMSREETMGNETCTTPLQIHSAHQSCNSSQVDYTKGVKIHSSEMPQSNGQETILKPLTKKVSQVLNFDDIKENVKKIRLPDSLWNFHVGHDIIIFYNLNIENVPQVKKSLMIKNEAEPVFTANNKVLSGRYAPKRLTFFTTLDIEKQLKIINDYECCTTHPKQSGNCEVAKHVRAKRCKLCQQQYRRDQNRDYQRLSRARKERANQKKKIVTRKILLQQIRRQKRTIKALKQKVKRIHENYLQAITNDFEGRMEKLNTKQRLLVQTCFDVSNAKTKHSVRYRQEWIYECLLMRIKSPQLYKYMRRNEILPLPSLETLRRYASNFKSIYGFQNEIFDAVSVKLQGIEDAEKHGILQIDEMSLAKGMKFDRSTCQIQGLVDMAQFTPDSDKTKLADHGLVLQFQSFKGAWTQALACFTTASNAPMKLLAKIMMECIILSEKAGLRIDAVVMDGASWNRGAWKLLGVTAKNPSATHPVRENNRLWMISDFPHLVKCGRNTVVKHKYLKTPDGNVDWHLWKRIADEDKNRVPKRCFTCDHNVVQPKGYQKMRVGLAMKFWGEDVASAMQLAKSKSDTEPGFENSQPTIDFIRRMNRLIKILNNRDYSTALRANSREMNDLETLYNYLYEWENLCKGKENETLMFSQTTMHGFKVTIKATIELCNYLCSPEVGFKYLLTRRLNQDALESFFGLIRAANGSAPHPMATQFGHLFKLLMMYSLGRPPKGSNVNGAEVLATLLKPSDSSSSHTEERIALDKKIDDIVQEGDVTAFFEEMIRQDHDYLDKFPDIYSTGYMSGFLCRISKRWVKCNECYQTLCGTGEEEHNKLTAMRTRGYLSFSSIQLFDYTYALESLLHESLKNVKLHQHVLLEVVEKLSGNKIGSNLGCTDSKHRMQLTKNVLNFYIIYRMQTICDESNKKFNESLQHVKMSRLR